VVEFKRPSGSLVNRLSLRYLENKMPSKVLKLYMCNTPVHKDISISMYTKTYHININVFLQNTKLCVLAAV